ncbi:MAG TPA: alpha/beta hydrolase [Dongiaceae bacterium]|nr:alpha/beta hydrolase [Dongiaceae bacterium]
MNPVQRRSVEEGRAAHFVIAALAAVAIAVLGIFALLGAATQIPSRKDPQDPADLLLKAEEVTFDAADGVRLAAWLVHGKGGAPAIILCHDLGGSRSDLLNSAVILNRAGYRLLLLDFRRHGGSGAARSTLGASERLDVLAAAEYLKNSSRDKEAPIGGWGVGMGAYALALAALETPELRALALDGPYRDIPSEADRRLRAMLPPPLGLVVPLARLLYDPYFRCRLSEVSLARRETDLGGRNVLIIAATEWPDRLAEATALYDAIPEMADGGRSLLTLRRSGLEGLYAEDRRQYDEAIGNFFATALPVSGRAASHGPIEVIER